MKCRSCENELSIVFADLVNSPASNSYLSRIQLDEPEQYYPLKVYVCDKCFLVQVEEYKKSDSIFDKDYAYFSSFSKSWLKHAQEYVDMITNRLKLNSSSSVIEIASNDGYLLKNFVAKGIPCYGVEPTANTAEAAKEHGVFSYVEFWGSEFANKLIEEHGKQDLILGNNVFAHTPYLNDFIEGLACALADNGTITLEFPHLLNLIKYNQFDTIYHEHFSYLSLLNIEPIFERFGLEVYDVEELPTHGGSLRIYGKHKKCLELEVTPAVEKMRQQEVSFGLRDIGLYTAFQKQIDIVKYNFNAFLLDAKQKGKKVVAYGAAAKGNTLLNYCGIKGTDLIEYVVDASPHKQGKFMPASHLPIVSENKIAQSKPDYIVILPWNIKDEISEQLSYAKEWGAKFVVAVPELFIF